MCRLNSNTNNNNKKKKDLSNTLRGFEKRP